MKQLILAAALAVAAVAATGAEAEACGRRTYVSYYVPHCAPCYCGYTTWNGGWYYPTWYVPCQTPTLWYHTKPCWPVGPGGVIIGSAPTTGPVQSSAAAAPTVSPAPGRAVVLRR